jgi:hypothetical protein
MAQGRRGNHSWDMRKAILAQPGDSIMDTTQTRFELRFQSLFDNGRGYAFPCDATGQVDLDGLSERARNNYLFARAMVGRDLAVPALRPCDLH